MAKNDVSVEVLRSNFFYDECSGVLRWIAPVKPNGKPQSTVRNNGGYQRVNVLGASRLVHRMCWIIAYGDIADGMTIDHINGDRLDNRLCNLRLASVAQNNQNIRVARAHSKIGIPGVSQGRGCKNFRARIKIGDKQVALGTFKTKEEAGAAFLEAKRKFHPMCTV